MLKMISRRSRIGHAALLAGVCMAVAVPASARSARDAFDGNWSIVITTQSGACEPSFRYGVQISNGKVLNNGNANIDVQGHVNRNGVVEVNVQAGGQSASGAGRLDPARGSGVWQGQGSVGACSGSWVAQRAPAETAGAEEPGGQPPIADRPAQSAVQSAVAACAARYHSYDAASGTFLGSDGLRHPCP